MNYLPIENSLDAALHPRFLNHNSTSLDILEPSKDQKAALGKRFFTNSRVYIYGRAEAAFTQNQSCLMSGQDFTVAASTEGGRINCLPIRAMQANDYGIFRLPIPSVSSGGGGTGDYNALTNKPIINFTSDEIMALPYTTSPTTYSVGDIGRVEGEDVPGYNGGVYSEFIYCVIDATNISTVLPAFSRVFITTLDAPGNLNPLTNTSYTIFVDASTALAPAAINTSYDARTLQSVATGVVVFGWVWKHLYSSAVVYVTPPPNPLPDVSTRRLNVKNT